MKRLPYGYWITPEGERIVAHAPFDHEYIAKYIVAEKGYEYDPAEEDVYIAMFRQGYVRVVVAEGKEFGASVKNLFRYHGKMPEPVRKTLLEILNEVEDAGGTTAYLSFARSISVREARTIIRNAHELNDLYPKAVRTDNVSAFR